MVSSLDPSISTISKLDKDLSNKKYNLLVSVGSRPSSDII